MAYINARSSSLRKNRKTMHRWHSLTNAARLLAWAGYLSFAACGGEPQVREGDKQADVPLMDLGQVQLRLDVGEEEIVGGVRYQITSPLQPAIMGTMTPEPGGKVLTVTVELPAGGDYTLLVAAYRANGEESCMISATFGVVAGVSSRVDLILECDSVTAAGMGDASVADGAVARPDAVRAAADAMVAVGGRDGALVDARSLGDAGAGDGMVSTSAAGRLQDAGRDGVFGPDLAADSGQRASEPALDGDVDSADAASAPDRAPDAAIVDDGGAIVDGDSTKPDAGRVGIDREACDLCSQRECSRLRGVERGPDCLQAGGTLTTGPGAGTARSAACRAVLECAHDTACSLGTAVSCYCGRPYSAQSCQAGVVAGACRGAFESAAQSTEPQRVIRSMSDDDSLLFSAVRLLQCESDRCRLACFGMP